MKRFFLFVFRVFAWIYIVVGVFALLAACIPNGIYGLIGSAIIGLIFLFCGIKLNKGAKNALQKLYVKDDEKKENENDGASYKS